LGRRRRTLALRRHSLPMILCERRIATLCINHTQSECSFKPFAHSIGSVLTLLVLVVVLVVKFSVVVVRVLQRHVLLSSTPISHVQHATKPTQLHTSSSIRTAQHHINKQFSNNNLRSRTFVHNSHSRVRSFQRVLGLLFGGNVCRRIGRHWIVYSLMS